MFIYLHCNVNISIRRLKQAMYCAHAFIQKTIISVYIESHLWLKKEVKCEDFLSVCPAGGVYLVQLWKTVDVCLSLTWVALGLLHTLVRSAWSASLSWRRRGGTCGTDRVVTGWRTATHFTEEITTDRGGQLPLSCWANSLNSDWASHRFVQVTSIQSLHSVPCYRWTDTVHHPAKWTAWRRSAIIMLFWVFKFVENSLSKDEQSWI